MPVYEFYCADCHRIFRFLSRRIDTDTRPSCPKCGRSRLERKPSTFAVSRGLEESDGPDPFEGMDEAALERAMAGLAVDADKIDEDDPRQAADLMRRMFQATGMPMGGAMEEMLRRMEAGEDPEAVEEELGDALEDEDELFGEGGASGRLARLRRKLPPNVDPELYEL